MKKNGANSNKMPAKEKQYYKQLLLEKKQDLLDEIKQISSTTKISPKDAAGDISGHALHMADAATDTYDREFSLGIASNDRKVIQVIDEALKRIDEGKFGLCLDCGKSISKARLKALPYAWLCVKCKESLEKTA